MYSFKNQTSVTFYKQPACLRSVTWCVCALCENNISPCPTSHWRLWRWLSWWHFKCYWWTDQQWVIVEPWFIMGTEVLSQEPLLAQRRWLWCAGSSTIGCSSIKDAAPSPVRCWPEWSGMTAGALPRISCWGFCSGSADLPWSSSPPPPPTRSWWLSAWTSLSPSPSARPADVTTLKKMRNVAISMISSSANEEFPYVSFCTISQYKGPYCKVHQDGWDPEACHPRSHAVLHGLWRESLQIWEPLSLEWWGASHQGTLLILVCRYLRVSM